MGNSEALAALIARAVRKYIPAGMEGEIGNRMNPTRSARTVESWRHGEHMPRGGELIQLMGILPDQFTNDVIAYAGMGGATRVNGEVCERKFLAVTANVAAEIARAQADGHTDHNEARRILAAMEPLVADAPHIAHKMRKKAAA